MVSSVVCAMFNLSCSDHSEGTHEIARDSSKRGNNKSEDIKVSMSVVKIFSQFHILWLTALKI